MNAIIRLRGFTSGLIQRIQGILPPPRSVGISILQTREKCGLERGNGGVCCPRNYGSVGDGTYNAPSPVLLQVRFQLAGPPQGDAGETPIVLEGSQLLSWSGPGGKTLLFLSGFVGIFSICAFFRRRLGDLTAAERGP